MKYEVLKRSHLKRSIVIALIVVGVISAIILNFTQAKYRTTQSIPLIQGTINYSASDLNIVAMYLNQDGAMPSGETNMAPKFGYTLNEEQSFCEVNDERIADASILYEDGYLYFNKLNRKGTKCSVYFDLIPDSEKPIIYNFTRKVDKTTINITVNATDNIGIYYYYYQLNDGEKIVSESNSYTFENLEEGKSYNVQVTVQDAVGNSAEYSEIIKAGASAKDLILANYKTILTRDNFASIISDTTTGTIYKSLDESQHDDFGEVYYFAGNPTDNWIQFAGFYWRIIRINGDGTIRIIYQGTSANATGTSTQIDKNNFNDLYTNNMYVGYMFENNQVHGLENSSAIKEKLDDWYINNLEKDYALYLDGNTGFCGDRYPSTSSNNSNGSGGTGSTQTYYASYIRTYNNLNPSLKCQDKKDLYTTLGSSLGNGKLDNPIGLINVDEVRFAGGNTTNNNNYYLYTGQNYWTMSPAYYYNSVNRAFVFYINTSGYIRDDLVGNSYGVRPVVNLSADVNIQGSGTTSDPFKVVGAS